MTLFAIVQIVVTTTAIGFCVIGALASLNRRRREKLRTRAHHWAATIVLDAGPNLEAASRDLSRLPMPLLAEVLQQLASDTTGESKRRLRVVAENAGLNRRIERLSRRRRWQKRVQAAHLLMLLPSGAPERELLLTDRHPFVRARAIESLSPSGVGRFSSLLLDSLGHESPAVQTATQHALARGGSDCVPTIVDGLDRSLSGLLDPTAAVRLMQVAAELPDPRLTGSLLAFADHDDFRLRQLTASSLGRGIFPEPEVHLRPLLADPMADVRAEAARAVGIGRVMSLAPALGRLLGDPQWQVRRDAGSALALLGPPGHIVLRCHLRDDDAFARDMAKHVLAQVNGQTANANTFGQRLAA